MKQYKLVLISILSVLGFLLVGTGMEALITFGVATTFSTFGFWQWVFQLMYWALLIVVALLVAIEETKNK